MNKILDEDLKYSYDHLSEEEKGKLYGSTILITGCSGFLANFHLSFYKKYGKALGIKKVIGIDTFLLGESPLITELNEESLFEIRKMDVGDFLRSDILSKYSIDYVVHMASVASPIFYRLFPIETIDSNIWGLRALLDGFKDRKLKSFLFYSSSEIYGDVDPRHVPTSEEYHGNVACIGPRACYDESKRFGETLCYCYNKQFGIPIKVVRVFNVYGPGMKINDRRVTSDFAKAIMNNEDIVVLSSGSPTRTFCYVSDSFVGEMKALLYDQFDVFNIGSPSPEINIDVLAKIFKTSALKIGEYDGNIIHSLSDDPDYLTDNPQRRCPDVSHARIILGYNPEISIEEGIKRYLLFLRGEKCNQW